MDDHDSSPNQASEIEPVSQQKYEVQIQGFILIMLVDFFYGAFILGLEPSNALAISTSRLLP